MGINFKREVSGNLDSIIEKLTNELKERGFGILTRIDFHTKMKEKLNKDLPPVVILGACNPALAFEAYTRNTDVTSLMPCNAVVREIKPGKYSVEIIKTSAMMGFLGDNDLVRLASDADAKLEQALSAL